MVHRGFVENGWVRPVGPLGLPEGTEVTIAPIEPAAVDVSSEDRLSGMNGTGFWSNRTLDELARERGVETTTEIDELAGEWPEEDSLEEFLDMVREGRA